MESNAMAEIERKEKERLEAAIKKVDKLLPSLSKILIVKCSDIGSFQFQKIRKLLRGEAEIVRGKVTHLRTAIRRHLAAHPELKPLLQHIKGEVGLVFTNMDVLYIKNKIESETVLSEVKPKTRAPFDIIVPACDTHLDPGKTPMLSAIGINTKIVKGEINIPKEQTILKKGDLITLAFANVLRLLNMKPITLQVKVLHAYINGTILDEKTLNEAPHQLEKSLHSGIQNIASISVAIGAANKSSMMYVLKSGLRNVQAVAIGLEEEPNKNKEEQK